MSEPFLSEIRIMSFTFAPQGWAQCDGQLLQINQNQALYSLLGTTYGGDGVTNFALPDLRGRAPLHTGNAHALGERAGEQSHTLATAEMPEHSHTANATSGAATTSVPDASAYLAKAAGSFLYASATNPLPMAAAAVASAGGSQAHLNMQPFLTLNFCIALQGLFPSPN